jgi:hypothetical protein
MQPMNRDAMIPQKLPDLSEETRRFLAGIRPEELVNLEMWVTMREEEREAMQYMVKKFSKEDFKTLNENVENFRAMKRVGVFSFWLLVL